MELSIKPIERRELHFSPDAQSDRRHCRYAQRHGAWQKPPSPLDHEILLRSKMRVWIAPRNPFATIESRSLSEFFDELLVTLARDELSPALLGVWGR
jgi:hypothetical protein